uniref:Uncharacterized protein n=1 Tax=Cucumis melo TaxID=3656 RepID=A0A9I9EAB5_CUCME
MHGWFSKIKQTRHQCQISNGAKELEDIKVCTRESFRLSLAYHPWHLPVLEVGVADQLEVPTPPVKIKKKKTCFKQPEGDRDKPAVPPANRKGVDDWNKKQRQQARQANLIKTENKRKRKFQATNRKKLRDFTIFESNCQEIEEDDRESEQLTDPSINLSGGKRNRKP